MTLSEAQKHLSELMGNGLPSADSALSVAQKEVIASMYLEFTGKAIRKCNCRNKYTDALLEINYLLRQMKSNNVMDNRYILKRGVVFHHKGQTYSRLNLTDDVAKAFLHDYPDAKWMFEVIPEDKSVVVGQSSAPRRRAKKKVVK